MLLQVSDAGAHWVSLSAELLPWGVWGSVLRCQGSAGTGREALMSKLISEQANELPGPFVTSQLHGQSSLQLPRRQNQLRDSWTKVSRSLPKAPVSGAAPGEEGARGEQPGAASARGELGGHGESWAGQEPGLEPAVLNPNRPSGVPRWDRSHLPTVPIAV